MGVGEGQDMNICSCKDSELYGHMERPPTLSKGVNQRFLWPAQIRPTCQLTQLHIPEDSNPQHLHCGNLQGSRLLSLLCEADHTVLRLKMQAIIQFLHTFLWCGT